MVKQSKLLKRRTSKVSASVSGNNKREQAVTDNLFPAAHVCWWAPIIETGKRIADDIIQGGEEWAELALTPLDLFKPILGNLTQHPITIFDPEIVQEAFSKARTHLALQLDEKPHQFMALHQAYAAQFQTLMVNTNERLKGHTVQPVIVPASTDKRFLDSAWQEDPYFDFLKQAYLLQAKLLRDVVHRLEGLDAKTHHKVDFYTRHFIEAFAPSNFPHTNPVVLRETVKSQGQNLIKGLSNYLSDLLENGGQIRMSHKSAFRVGENLATTPGKVVFENALFQLIQYMPQTSQVNQTPLLIIPPWFNKYYIFDLREENSFIRWAVNSGLTVFIVSWVNPDKQQSRTSFSDYIFQGAKKAVEMVCQLTHVKEINAVGYCAGGIALSCLLGYYAHQKHNPIRAGTVIATPIDTSQGGDILVYICEKQLKKLEKHMETQGYLSGRAMTWSFNMLRPNNLIWFFYINNYLLGREPLPFDMLHWNADRPRMPGKMHAEYLRYIFLENRLMPQGQKSIRLNKTPVDLQKVQTPLFIFGTQDDHIAPWRSVYALSQLVQGSTTFVLGGSGHVAGVFNSPQKVKYGYWMNSSCPSDPNEWFKQAEKHEGSWWPAWRTWLTSFCGDTVPARYPDPRHIIEEAPGRYALMSGD